ncbi:MAG TPA: Ig domain-containing protein, partial [Bryobacteraceae bacterium]|nr:Ig domain-containing protein [Bryobacteraceae bacterium]
TVASGSLPAGLTLSGTGNLAGTPSSPGSFNFTAQAADSAGATAKQPLSMSVGQGVTITTSASLPKAIQGVAYSATLTTSGGSGGVKWSVTSGQVPPGLTLSSGGAISGTPIQAGTYSFTVQATDSSSSTATAPFSLAVLPALTLNTGSALSNGAVGAQYNQTLVANGGVPPDTWALTGGNLPPGLSLSAGGSIAGTPTQTGTFQFTLQVTDSAGSQAHGDFTIQIFTGITVATPPVLPAASVGAHYTLALQAAGGAPPYVWSVTAGSLPAGLNFGGDGKIDGTPTTAGSFQFTAQVADSAGNRANKDFTLAVTQGLTITTGPTLPGGAAGVAYSVALAASGGTTPYTWSVTGGSLPAGITLDGSSGALGGTPTAKGDFTFTVTVTDSASNTAQKQFSLSIGQGISFTNPAALPNASAGTPYQFKLGASGGAAPYSFKLAAGPLPDGLSLNATSGVISGTPTLGGTFNFTLQVTDANGVSAQRVHTLVVTLPPAPAVVIGGLTDHVGPVQQPLVDIALANPYPATLSGSVSLAFKPSGSNPDDPSVQFSTGGRSATFTIPANATHANFAAPQFAVQTGSVAGTITITVQSLQSGNTAVPLPAGNTRTVTVDAAAPVISGISVIRTSGGFNIQLTAVSNTRDLAQVVVTFQPSAGSTLSAGQATVPLGGVAQSWFGSNQSAAYGGQFTLTLPFTIQGAANALDSVSVVLNNSAGASQASSAPY